MIALADRLPGETMIIIPFADWLADTDSLSDEEKP